MACTEMQSTFEQVNNIKFEDKIDVEDLVLPPKPTGTHIMEKIDIKEEPLDIDIIAVHERTKQSGFAGIRFEKEDFPSDMENQISKLFEELDQLRVEKVKQLFEKYHSTTVEMLENNLEDKKTELSKLKQEFDSTRSEFEITNHQMSIENTSLKAKMVEITEEHKVALSLNSKAMNSIVKMHEKSLKDKDIELKRVCEEHQIVKVANLEFSKRIQEPDIAYTNQVSAEKKSTNSGFQTFDRLEESKQSLNKKQKYENQKVSRNKKTTVQSLEKPGEIPSPVQVGTSVGVSVEVEIEDNFASTGTIPLNVQIGNDNITTVDPLMPMLIPANDTVIHSLLDETLKEEPSELIITDLFGKSEISIDPVDIPDMSIKFDWQDVNKENDIDDLDNTDNFETEDNSNLPGENEQVGSDHENTQQEHIVQVHEGKIRESKRNQHLKCSSCGYRSETRYGMNKHITQQHKDPNVKTINTAPTKAKISCTENQKPLDIRKEIEAERKKRNVKPKEKSLRERRGNSKVPSYKDFYCTSSSSENDAATGTH